MLILKSIYAVFKREVKCIITNRLYFISLIVLPLVMITLFTLMFERGSIDELPIVVVDNDKSVTSWQLTSMIQDTRGVGDITECNSTIEANNIVRRGDARAMLVIPSDFERDIVSGKQSSASVLISGANLSTAGVLQRDIQQAVQSLSASVASGRMISMGYSQDQAISDILPINVDMHTISNPYMNYGYYLAPMFIFVGIVLFTMLTTIYAVGRELYYASAEEWLMTANNSLLIAMVGKLLPVAIVMVAIMGVAYFVLFVIMGMQLMCSHLMLLLISILLIAAYQSIAVAITAITANMRLALSLGGGYAVMAFTFSGVTFPIIAMYGVAQLFAKAFPLTYYNEIFINQALRGAGVEHSIEDFWALLIFIALGCVVWRRLDRVVRSEEYWRKD